MDSGSDQASQQATAGSSSSQSSGQANIIVILSQFQQKENNFYVFYSLKKKNFMMQDKISAVLWMTRVFTILCTFFFIIPLTNYDPNALYQKALVASAATSALKLHQRMTNTPFAANREYFAKLMIEDSFHYLMFALIFLNIFPVTSKSH